MSEQAPIHPTVYATKLEPLHKDVMVYDMYFGEQTTKAGIILIDDDKTDRGIHPRWAKVYAVGSENRDDIEKDNWILIEHGRWSRGIELNCGIVVRRVDPTAILMKSNSEVYPEKACLLGK